MNKRKMKFQMTIIYYAFLVLFCAISLFAWHMRIFMSNISGHKDAKYDKGYKMSIHLLII